MDPLAADRLVRENLGWLRGWVRSRVRDPELAHDICQDAVLKALRAARTLKDHSKFPSWLYRIAQNTLRDHLRRQARRRRWLLFTDNVDPLEARVHPSAPRGAGSNPAQAEEAAEEAERLLEAVQRLPPRYREPLLLRHSEDLPYARIAEILGISENAVQVRIFRARKMLKDAEGKQKVTRRKP